MNILKKQGVAWVITVLMILLAIFIGLAKAPLDPVVPVDPPVRDPVTVEPGIGTQETFYVYDEAGVLSAAAERTLTERNKTLYQDMGVLVAVVTANYGWDDLYDFALDYAERIGLRGSDFIVVLDISGENYWLVQGADLTRVFTDDDCGRYAWDYMEDAFAAGDYDKAVLRLTEALEEWYRYNG